MRRAFSGAAFVLIRASADRCRGLCAIDLDELGGNDRARLPIDLDEEIAGTEVFDRAAPGINGRDVDGDQIDAGPEPLRL